MEGRGNMKQGRRNNQQKVFHYIEHSRGWLELEHMESYTKWCIIPSFILILPEDWGNWYIYIPMNDIIISWSLYLEGMNSWGIFSSAQGLGKTDFLGSWNSCWTHRSRHGYMEVSTRTLKDVMTFYLWIIDKDGLSFAYVCLHVCVRHSVMSNSLWLHGL